MDTAQRPAEQPVSTNPAPETRAAVDLEALTAAVERLLRRDLRSARERLRGAKRRRPGF